MSGAVSTARANCLKLDGRITTLDRSQALDRFLASVERRAFRMAHIATGDPDEAMDLVQDAMLKLVHRYSDHDETEWPPLFHKILQSRIRDWYRRTRVRNRWLAWLGQRESDADQDDLLESAPDTGTPPSDERLARKRAVVALEAALRSLPFRQQQAFMLRAWEELDVAATARAMGCSEGSVKTHYFRAVHALRQLLKAHWP